MVEEHRQNYPSLCATIESLALKFGCVAQTLYEWMTSEQLDAGERPRTVTEKAERLKALEREKKQLRRANEILRTDCVCFARAELDRKLKS